MAGLPNITSNITSSPYGKPFVGQTGNANPTTTGAFVINNFIYRNQIPIGNGYGESAFELSFNASLSNPTYGNSSTVTPTSQSTLYVMKY